MPCGSSLPVSNMHLPCIWHKNAERMSHFQNSVSFEKASHY